MICAIRPRTAPAEVTLRSAAPAGVAKNAAVIAIKDMRRRVIFPSLRPRWAHGKKLSAIVSRMRRGAIIARCRGNSHGRRDARPQSEVVRERPNYFGGSKPAAVQRSAIAAEVSALMKARAEAGSV